MNYLDRVKGTYLENWPAALHRLTMAGVDLPLSSEEADYLAAANGEYGSMPWEQMAADPRRALLVARLDEALTKFPFGAFVRLGSRSPKDSWLGHREGFKVTAGERALQLLTDSSERVHDDLALAKMHAYQPHVWVRQWLDMPSWAEWRCFQWGGELVGISQYQYNKVFDELTPDTVSLAAWGIDCFHHGYFKKASYLKDVVFDVYTKIHTRRDNSREIEVMLIECNPLFEMTDPCLYTWKDGGDFDKGIRVRK